MNATNTRKEGLTKKQMALLLCAAPIRGEGRLRKSDHEAKIHAGVVFGYCSHFNMA